MNTICGPTLHYVFLPWINKALGEFGNSWNNHPICIAGHKSPQQLLTAGDLLLQNLQLAAMDCFENVIESYGIDPEGPAAVDDDDGEDIVISQTLLKFNSYLEPTSGSLRTKVQY